MPLDFTLPLYASLDISKPRYFKLFFHFPWDFKIAGFDCNISLLKSSHRNSQRNHMNRIYILQKTSSDRLINLDACHELFCISGDFLCIRDAGHGGNRITVTLLISSRILFVNELPWSVSALF